MSDAVDAIRALYDTGKYADMKIRCEDKVFDVHRAVVCMRSPVIAAAMDNDRWEEAAKGEYHMIDEKLPIVEAMIDYLYCGNYDDQVALEIEASDDYSQSGLLESLPKTATDSFDEALSQLHDNAKLLKFVFGQLVPRDAPLTKASPLLFNAKVYVVADKYMIPSLKSLADEKFTKSLGEHWNTPEFTASAKFLWENTPLSGMQLRRSVVTTAATHLDVLLDRGEFVNFMSEYGDFAVAVMKNMKRRDCLIINTPKADREARNSEKHQAVKLPAHLRRYM